MLSWEVGEEFDDDLSISGMPALLQTEGFAWPAGGRASFLTFERLIHA